MPNFWQRTIGKIRPSEDEQASADAPVRDPLADVDFDAFNARTRQLRNYRRARGEDAALSVGVGESIVVVDTSPPVPSPEAD